MRRKPPRAGIERKILTSIVWVSAIPMVLALGIGYTFAIKVTQVAVEEDLGVAAEKTARGLGLILDARCHGLATLAQDSAVLAALTRGTNPSPEVLAAVQKRFGTEAANAPDGAASVSLYDAEGILLISSAPPGAVEERLTPAERATTVPSLTSLQYDAEQARSTVRLLAPVHGDDASSAVGFISKREGVSALLEFVLSENLWDVNDVERPGTYQLVYRDLGDFYLSQVWKPSKGDKMRLTFDRADARLTERLVASKTDGGGSLWLSHYRTPKGERRVCLGYHSLPGFDDVFLVVYRTSLSIFGILHIGLALAFTGSALVIPFFVLVAYRDVHNNIARPIALLNEGAQIIRQGDLDLKLKIGTGDEIEELASSFNKMAIALKHNIRQLEDSEEKYRGLINSMRDGVCQADPDGTITFVNPAGLEILGYGGVEDATGANLRDLFLKMADYDFILGRLSEQNFVEGRRLWLKRNDGRAICVELSFNRVFDDEGHFIGGEGIFRDVSESLRLEQEARERSEHIQVINQIANAINSSLEAGMLYESITAEMKKLVDFDYASLSLLTEAEDVFQTRQLLPEESARTPLTEHSVESETCAAWVARMCRPLRVRSLDEDGVTFASEFPTGIRSCLSVPLYARERIVGTLNLGSNQRDGFSEHHEEIIRELALHVAVAIRNAQLVENLQASLEEVTRAREKLYEANEELKTLDETKTNLLSNVSHELRTPLVSVMGYTDMILHEKAGALTDTQREYLSISLRNVEKLVTLIENLLDFSRLHRGMEELMFDMIDLADCVRTSMEIIKPVADGRGIRIELIAPDTLVYVDGDKGKLGQVFNNLLANAVKFNHNGGAVTVTLEAGLESAEVRVADTGIGIPADALDKVFTRFYQVDGSSTRKYGGTGIGLAIVQDIVRLHGSRITVTSQLGEGSTFRFTLPLANLHKDAADAAGDTHQAQETHFLIELVSADRALCQQLNALLGPEGMHLVCASHAANAVMIAKKYKPDCIMIDVEENGDRQEEISEVLNAEALGELPVILVTNDSAVHDRYHERVAWRVNRAFNKSDLLRGIHYAIGQGIATPESGGAKVLCVDDDKEILTFMRRCLEIEGCDVECCLTGEEAIERLKLRRHGVVLLDVAMPGIDGWETCRRIKADVALAGVRVLLVTAKPLDSSLQRVRECGADGYLLKPFKAEDLVGLVLAPAGRRLAQQS